MMKKRSILLLMLLAFTIFSFLNSCKKTDQATASPPPKTTDIPEWVKAEMREQKGGITYVINKKSPAIFIDEQGNERNFSSLRLLTIPCDAEEEDFLDNTFTHLYQTVWYACGEDYKLTVEYVLSTAFTPAAANPSNPSQLSRGRFRIVDPVSGSTIYSNNSVTPLSITPIGTDPLNSDKQLYRISYTVTGLTETIMTTSGVFQNRPIIYSTCPDVITTPSNWEGALPGPVVDACSKVDRISMVAGGAKVVYFGGCDEQISTTGSCYPGGLADGRPHEHDIEWRKPGDPTFGNWPMPLPAFGSLTVNSYDQRVSWPYFSGGCVTYPLKKERLAFYAAAAYTFPSTGIYEIRYRNVKLTSFGSACSTNNCTTSDWVYTTINVP